MSKSKSKTLQDKLKDFFAKNQAVNRVYVTSDGQLFRAEHYANNWACELKDRTVKPHSRAMAEILGKIEDRMKAGKGDAEVDGAQNTGSDTDAESDATDERQELITEHIELFDTKPAKNIGLQTLKDKINGKKAEIAAEDQDSKESELHAITNEDLKNNPKLVEEGVKVGDKVELPKEEK